MYFALLAIAVPLLLLLIATACDLRWREVPDWVSVAILVWAVVATAFGMHNTGWTGLVAGLLVGFVLSAAVFYMGGLGGADVKLIAAIGAFLGPVALLFALVWMGLAGGLLAMLAAMRGQRDYAYVPAISAGFLGCIIYPGGGWQLLLHSIPGY